MSYVLASGRRCGIRPLGRRDPVAHSSAVLVAAAWILNPWRPKGAIRLGKALPEPLQYRGQGCVNLALGFLSDGLEQGRVLLRGI